LLGHAARKNDQKYGRLKKVAVIFTIPVPGVHFFAIRSYRNLDGLDPVT
jgi:hypothetical protein